MTRKIEVYIKPGCPFCTAAGRLLKSKGAAWTEIDIAAEPDRREEMIERSGGRRTVPQLFIGDEHVGGFDDLDALDQEGALDRMLAGD
ncbi:MAG: glutaredoxin 3 [Gammaproteobacteria bacterium]|jgi:glutaredoxin 3|nr:glutaredoxin 3 [Gammaproteobacteria bacterium]